MQIYKAHKMKIGGDGTILKYIVLFVALGISACGVFPPPDESVLMRLEERIERCHGSTPASKYIPLSRPGMVPEFKLAARCDVWFYLYDHSEEIGRNEWEIAQELGERDWDLSLKGYRLKFNIRMTGAEFEAFDGTPMRSVMTTVRIEGDNGATDASILSSWKKRSRTWVQVQPTKIF